MAYRRSNGKGRKKIEPAALTMLFNTPTVSAGAFDEFYIDLSQSASLLNRRFYRQGINWAVASIKVLSPITAGSLFVQKLPQSWVMSNAWMKGFKAWQRLNQEAMSESESVRPRFLDFKIYADAQHHFDGFGANLLPKTLSQLPGGPQVVEEASAGEWESSKYVIPKTDGTDDVNSREIIAVGPSYPGASPASTLNAVSLIEGYASSRGLPDVLDPNTPTDIRDAAGTAPENWMQALFNEGTEQDDAVLTDLSSENNIAPYPFENDGVNTDTMYPGGANQLNGLLVHDHEFITGTTIGGTTHIDGGMFPCGLIKFIVENTSGLAGNISIQVNLVPGTHRGYLCEPMTEM
jgi:hypothetical protein